MIWLWKCIHSSKWISISSPENPTDSTHGSICNICCSVSSVLQKKKFSLHRWTGCLVNMLCRSLLYNGCIMKQFMCKLADLVGMDHWEIKQTVFCGLLLYWTVYQHMALYSRELIEGVMSEGMSLQSLKNILSSPLLSSPLLSSPLLSSPLVC